MLIAREKRKTNIAEYILYIWQLEDLLRALDFDLDKIGSALVAQFQVDEDTRIDLFAYYKNMVLMMQKEQVTQSGHIRAIRHLTDDLNRFHLKLLGSAKDPQYRVLFQFAKPVIDEFRLKSNDVDAHDVSIALQAMYSVMLLKLQQKKVSDGTRQATAHVGKLLAHLAARYKQFEEDEFEF